jgi:uncharacterized protein (UPF0335 family)
MTKNEFKEFIKSNIKYQRLKGNSMSYILGDGEVILCPFCKAPMRPTKVGDGWIHQCTCFEAIKANDQLNDLIGQIEQLQDEVSDIFKTIDEASISYFTSFYKELMRVRDTKQREEDAEILSLKTLD